MTDDVAVEPQEAPTEQPQDGQPDLTPDWVRDSPDDAYKLLKSTREEAAAHRVKAREAAEALDALRKQAEREKLDEVGRLKADLDEWQDKYQQLEANLTTERYRSQLAGHVANIDDAVKLLDEKYIRDGTVDVKAFLEAKPYLAAKATSAVRNMNPPARTGGSVDDMIRSAVKGR
jgi:predicted phage-related endonuclease